MDWSGENDAWHDAFLSLDGCGIGDDFLATLFDRDSCSDDAPDRASSGEDACARPAVHCTNANVIRAMDIGLFPQDSKTDSPHGKATTLQQKKKKRSANTTKVTIERLRESVHEAECKLALLRSRQQQYSASPGIGNAHDRVACALSTSVWKDVATRQYQWRQESEVANERLRAACREQEKIMQGLQRLVLRSHAVLQSRTPMTIVPVDVEGARYTHRINELMAVTSDMYMQAQLGLLPDTSDLTGSGSGAADLYNSIERLVPCPQQAVSSAVWSYFCRSSGESESYFRERIDTSQDTVVKSFLVRWANETASVNHRGIIVARRFAHLNGLDLIVYTAELEALQPDGDHHAPALSHGFRMNAWTILRPSQGWQDHSEVIIRHVTSPFATLRTDSRSKLASSGGNRNSMGQFARFAQFSLSRHLERVQRAIDGAFM